MTHYISKLGTEMNNLESYPPVLRHLDQQHRAKADTDEEGDPIQDPDPVAVIDLECLEHEQKKLEEACKNWGIFRLVNHGVPLTLLKDLQEVAKELFSMSFECKEGACSGTPVTYFWGTPALTPSGAALTGGPQNINWVEGFDVPLSQLSHFNPQIPTLQSIRLLLMDYENHLSRIATTLFEAMAKNLELNLKPPKPYLSENTGMVRVYRYPHCTDTNVGWGMEAHTDSSILSILNQNDEVSGLQVLKDDQWLTIKPISDTFIVNLGDMMQAISDDRYKSVTHRVKINKHRERISICYFVFPGEELVIESSKYKPFTYNEFRAQVQQDIKAIGHKVGLARFQQIENC
ncbi:gibberellin 2-beta-dioxygenase 8-like [Abrus precatorius]|uniref:Gibberellin 2-beta-dioxygenase 8-like n=1 Tax=Abrus precatorius TaxID=3816 RepID=A0A8B8K1M9_ABRPR|nr:gibberellin 2-beta-dioxygenase 8-like [Abrus precatorius]